MKKILVSMQNTLLHLYPLHVSRWTVHAHLHTPEGSCIASGCIHHLNSLAIYRTDGGGTHLTGSSALQGN